MIRLVFLLCLLVFSPAFAGEAAPRKTIVKDAGEARLLEGRHLFSTAALAIYCLPDCLGNAVIYKRNGLYYFFGGHIRFFETKGVVHWGAGSVNLRGVITEIHAGGFVFEGKIETDSLHNSKWYPCAREGRFEFTRNHDVENRVDYEADFWRLYFKDAPETCGINSDTSYIDMFVENLGYN